MTEYKRNDWLTDYRIGFYSQSGEEGVLDKIFEVLSIRGDKWCVEFGASNGMQDINSRHLINDLGWFGLAWVGLKWDGLVWYGVGGGGTAWFGMLWSGLFLAILA